MDPDYDQRQEFQFEDFPLRSVKEFSGPAKHRLYAFWAKGNDLAANWSIGKADSWYRTTETDPATGNIVPVTLQIAGQAAIGV